jgi:Phage integrase, N-terminal SAM-like domain
MASIFERPNGTFQARVTGSDGRLITRVSPNEKSALEFSLQLEGQKISGESVTGKSRQISLDEYFRMWFEDMQTSASNGWRKTQKQIFRDHISPFLGKLKLSQVNTPSVMRVLNYMAHNGYSEQMRLHVYILLRKLFGDAIEIHQLLSFNPVIRKIKPRIPYREAKHLNLDQIRQLLAYVIDKDYGLAIFVQLYLGLRVGESSDSFLAKGRKVQVTRFEGCPVVHGLSTLVTSKG